MSPTHEQQAVALAMTAALRTFLRAEASRGIAVAVIDRTAPRPLGPTFSPHRRRSP